MYLHNGDTTGAADGAAPSNKTWRARPAGVGAARRSIDGAVDRRTTGQSLALSCTSLRSDVVVFSQYTVNGQRKNLSPRSTGGSGVARISSRGVPVLRGAPGPRGPSSERGPSSTNGRNQSAYNKTRLQNLCIFRYYN